MVECIYMQCTQYVRDGVVARIGLAEAPLRHVH